MHEWEATEKSYKSRGTIKGGVGGKASADAEGVEENRERNFGTIQGVVDREALKDEIEVERLISRTCHCSFIKKKKRKARRKTYQKSILARYNRL